MGKGRGAVGGQRGERSIQNLCGTRMRGKPRVIRTYTHTHTHTHTYTHKHTHTHTHTLVLILKEVCFVLSLKHPARSKEST